jgi:3-hydroxyacyl-CoA dehydrogenase/enoyl-CoA hydratase/3-hydroxybutyryl-CoA epimerase
MVNTAKLVNWDVTTDAQGICWLTIDRKDASANTLGSEVLHEFELILTQLEAQRPKGLVIKSGKTSGFIAGADVAEFIKFKTVSEAETMVLQVQEMFNRLSALPFPTVAMINGFCLGGGFELALACRYRVALDSPKTKIGLPEILLGVQPGWGGSVRLPKLIGSPKALELILAGKTVDARTAYKLGMVDAAVPERQFLTAVQHYVTTAPAPKVCGKLEKLIQQPLARRLLGKYLTQQVAKKANKEHYPAPYAVIDTWVENSIYSPDAFVAEAASISKLIVSNTARNLVRVFFLRDRLKSFAKASEFAPKHVHVIGAGVMGGDIAAWCALNGFNVTVQDQNVNAIAATLQRARTLYSKRLKQPYLVQAACDRLVPDTTGFGIAKADVIIEAIIENAAAKQEVFGMLESTAKPNAILATNTSTIPLDVIGKNLKQPGRVVGIHFFNPVPLMPLVEVVSDPHTNPHVVANALAFVGKIDKLPLPVKSNPGFLVNRILIPYLFESGVMFQEGIPGPVIDKAATDFGMPMGPIELLDTIGLDVCVAAGESMHKNMPDVIVNLVKAGKLGKKTGEGIYKYTNGKPNKPRIDPSQKYPDDITDRMIMAIVNESAAALREGVVTDADLVDAGMVFGAGFAPFRGGPMEYASEQQKDNIKIRLEALASRYGARFEADPAWSS